MPSQKWIKVSCRSLECPHFNKCALIKTNIVYRGADIQPIHYLFVGQGGGAEEEATHQPFVGPSGKRIRMIMEKMVIPRIKFEINYAFSNTVRCRPEGNRPPDIPELRNCLGYLKRDIAYLKPLVIIALGVDTFTRLYGQFIPMGKAHGKECYYMSVGNYRYPLIATYHPSACIRNGAFGNDLDRTVAQDLFNNFIPF